MKDAYAEFMNRLATAEESISDQRLHQQKPPRLKRTKTRKKIKQNIQGLWNNNKRCNIHVIEIPEGEAKKEQNI